MNVRTAANAPLLERAEADALLHAQHGDPFRLLGPHESPVGPIVRALLPGAEAVEVLRRSDGSRLGRLQAVEGGLFQGIVSERTPSMVNTLAPSASASWKCLPSLNRCRSTSPSSSPNA